MWFVMLCEAEFWTNKILVWGGSIYPQMTGIETKMVMSNSAQIGMKKVISYLCLKVYTHLPCDRRENEPEAWLCSTRSPAWRRRNFTMRSVRWVFVNPLLPSKVKTFSKSFREYILCRGVGENRKGGYQRNSWPLPFLRRAPPKSCFLPRAKKSEMTRRRRQSFSESPLPTTHRYNNHNYTKHMQYEELNTKHSWAC